MRSRPTWRSAHGLGTSFPPTLRAGFKDRFRSSNEGPTTKSGNAPRRTARLDVRQSTLVGSLALTWPAQTGRISPEISPGALSTAVQKGRRAANPMSRNGSLQKSTAVTLVPAAYRLRPRSEAVAMPRRGGRTGRMVVAGRLHASASRSASAIRGRCSGPLGYVNLRTGICLTS